MRLLDGHMDQIINKLEAHESKTLSRWREAAEYRQTNKSWLRRSQRIAMLMLEKMDELHLTQKELAQRMSCSQQYVSKILRGKENLSIETLCKIEDALSPFTPQRDKSDMMKLYSHDEMLDRVLGSKGTPARNDYERKINRFLIKNIGK
ncbi:helix-turn-helix domain-containing protein [Prevotella sp. oral taxon 317]|jgi:hypothetical protein|uniref:helix-turn-helix domain-containing protein n=1 Tax=Prevotella sp. oral taxon 317 TaxID=652721 RepID=UPI001E60C43D